MKKLENISKYKYFIFFIIIIISFIRSNINSRSIYNADDTKFSGIITDYKIKDDYLTFTLKGREKIKCNYYFNDDENIKIKYGDIVSLSGKLKIPSNNTIPNTFNYKKYLNNNDIFYTLTIDKILSIKRNKNVFYKIKNFINDRVNSIDKSGYLNAFILGNKSYIDSDVYDTFKNNGIMHIFSVSGMHISILATLLLFVLNKINNNDNNIYIVILFLIFYMILTNYQASIVRSVVFYILLKLFTKLNLKIETKDTLLISISLILLFNPKFIFNIGFLYSSIISFSLILYSDYFNKKYFINIFLISLVSFLISLPITINNNYFVNLLGIFINIIFVPIISFILYPLSLIVFIIPHFYTIFLFFVNIIEKLSIFFSNIKIFNISIPKMNILCIIIYYILVIITLSKNKKNVIFLFVFIIIMKYVNLLDLNYYIYYLDIGQGDMSVIKYKDKVTVIDTGPPTINKNYEIMDNVITLFMSIGINDIDYLVITHGDSDHIGNAEYLVNNFKVKKVIINNDEYNELENSLINNLKEKNIKYFKNLKKINIKNSNLLFLDTGIYDNENDNSLVNYIKIYNYKFLFMGDASLVREKDILGKYNISNIDVLKVGHHGSKTSSNKEFIDKVKPKYSVISVGKNNRYGHPNNEVLNNLKDSKIYRTDIDGSIKIELNKKGYKVKAYSP